MGRVVFDKAKVDLTQHCIALMQNLSNEDSDALGIAVRELDREELNKDIKTLQLGLILMNTVGEDVLSAAVNSLGDKLRDPLPEKPAP